MTANQISRQLSTAARAALSNTPGRQGAVPSSVTPSDVMAELGRHGLTGPLGGLTRLGTIVRDFVMTEDLDDAFGPA